MGDRKLNSRDIEEIDKILAKFPTSTLSPLYEILQKLTDPPWGKRSLVRVHGYIEGTVRRLIREHTATRGDCRVHGEQRYLYSGIIRAWVCEGCLADGFYRNDITEEVAQRVVSDQKRTPKEEVTKNV